MRKTKSPILEAVHDTAKGLHKAGVMDQVTLHEFDGAEVGNRPEETDRHRPQAAAPGAKARPRSRRLSPTGPHSRAEARCIHEHRLEASGNYA
jgi:hypothetical protein